MRPVESGAVKERPILFSGDDVRAILAGTKTQTRRVVRIDDSPVVLGADVLRRQRGIPRDAANVRMCGPYLKCDAPRGSNVVSSRVPCPYGVPGDRLWVRETWAPIDGLRVVYRADFDATKDRHIWRHRTYPGGLHYGGLWRPSIHMPRWASRITLEVVSVRVDRLQAITEEDARAEGVTPVAGRSRGTFALTWGLINGKRADAAWASNPWVWRIEFRRVGR